MAEGGIVNCIELLGNVEHLASVPKAGDRRLGCCFFLKEDANKAAPGEEEMMRLPLSISSQPS
jgi:hypothetical protein